MARPESSGSPKAIVYGIQPVLEALRSDTQIDGVWIERGSDNERLAQIGREARGRRASVRVEPREALTRLAGTDRHQGVVARLAATRYTRLEDLLEGMRSRSRPALLVALDGVEDPQNLGAILRAADGAGADGAILPERRASGVTAAVVKASSGAAVHLPIARVVNLARTLDDLRRAGFWTVGLDPDSKKVYTEVDYRVPVALVAGAEDRGLRPGVAERCDLRVAIPMLGRVKSLNVSVAVAIVLYEAVRQRAGR